MSSPKYLEKLILPIFFIFVALLFLHPFEGGGDFYHHVNTGKQILEERTFPYTDIYTHTAQGQPWIAYAWGSGIIFYLVFSIFGEIGISILVAFIGTFTMVLLYYYLRSLKISNSISLLGVFLATGPVLTRFPNRPEIFTYPMVLLLLLIDLYRNKYPRFNFFFPLVILIWANLYGSSTIAGIGLILLFILKQLWTDKWKLLKSQRLFYLSALLVIPTAFLNPNTYKTVFYMLIYIPRVSEYEGEWAGVFRLLRELPFSAMLGTQYLILIYFLFLACALLIVIFSLKQIRHHYFLSVLALAAFLPLFAFRQTPLATLLSIPFLCKLISGSGRYMKPTFISLLIITSSICLVLVLWVTPVSLYSANKSSDYLLRFLRTAKLQGNVFNHQSLGSFLSYYFYPDLKVFYDTRDDLFIESSAFRDLYQTQMTSSNIMSLIDKYKVDIVVADLITDSLGYRNLFYANSWSLIYFNDRYAVFVKDSLLKEYQNIQPIHNLDPFSLSGAKPGFEKEATYAYQQMHQKNPGSLINKLHLANNLMYQERNDEALEILKDAQVPNNPFKPLSAENLYFLLTQAYIFKKDCSKAKYYLDLTQASVEGKFIFQPDQAIPSNTDKASALYYLICQGDRNKAIKYLIRYLQRPDVTPLEKAITQDRFDKEAQKQGI